MTWQPITTAPRDGTVIEIQCTYGAKPWTALVRWVDDRRGAGWIGWHNAENDDSGVDPDFNWSLKWRPVR
jgi:hypothetical protein